MKELKNLTRLEELQLKLQENEKRAFYNQMVDRWGKEEFELDRKLFLEKQEILKEMEELKGEKSYE